jgi:hypothetical protein
LETFRYCDKKIRKSSFQIKTISKWLELGQQLLEGKAIDYENQLCIQKEGNTGRVNWKD